RNCAPAGYRSPRYFQPPRRSRLIREILFSVTYLTIVGEGTLRFMSLHWMRQALNNFSYTVLGPALQTTHCSSILCFSIAIRRITCLPPKIRPGFSTTLSRRHTLWITATPHY